MKNYNSNFDHVIDVDDGDDHDDDNYADDNNAEKEAEDD